MSEKRPTDSDELPYREILGLLTELEELAREWNDCLLSYFIDMTLVHVRELIKKLNTNDLNNSTKEVTSKAHHTTSYERKIRSDAYVANEGGDFEFLDKTSGLIYSILHCRLYHKHLTRGIASKSPADLKTVAKVLQEVGLDYLALSDRCNAKWQEHDRAFRVARNTRRREDAAMRQDIRQSIIGQFMRQKEFGEVPSAMDAPSTRSLRAASSSLSQASEQEQRPFDGHE